MRKAKRVLLPILTGILLITLGISIIQICKTYREYAEESRQHQELLAYKPTASAPPAVNLSESESILPPMETEQAVVNQSVIDLRERYPEAVGWLTIDGTEIDYPFVQAKDNQTYLRHDMDLNYLVSGTVFMDYRNAADFSDFATILYGHRMKNDSMFGSMERFRADEFFLENSTGRIHLSCETLELEIAALLVVRADDKSIYELGADSDEDKENFIAYILENAEQLRAVAELTLNDRFVLLSTCVDDFEGARMVLVTRIIDE